MLNIVLRAKLEMPRSKFSNLPSRFSFLLVHHSILDMPTTKKKIGDCYQLKNIG